MRQNTQQKPSPLDVWVESYRRDETTLPELMRYLNRQAKNMPHRLRRVSECLRVIRDSKPL
jgi:hypothetical protein